MMKKRPMPIQRLILPLCLLSVWALGAEVNEPAATGAGPLTIDIPKAILLALEHNASLAVERVNPEIQRTVVDEERAAFEPVLSGNVAPRRSVADRLSRAGSGIDRSTTVDSLTGTVSLTKPFASGTTVGLSGSTSYTDSSLYSDTFTSTRLGVTVTQALLRGLDLQANLARVDQARLDTRISEYELRGFTEILVAQVESTFWDYALAQRQIEIYTNSVTLAEQQLAETRERIKIGRLAETELAAAQAEVALRRENLINARSTLNTLRLMLLWQLNPSKTIQWDADVVLEYQMTLPTATLDGVEPHVQVALRMRPDLNQARLQIKRGDLEVVRTRNGLLPRLDLFIDLGKSGYANAFSDSVQDLDGRSYDATAGLQFELAPSNRGARAQHTRAKVTQHQLRQALENLTQLVQVDVRTAYGEVNRTCEQITATTATRTFQEEKLRAETEKFRVGRSTSILVAQAQRDLVASQIAEIQAVANSLKALVNLYRLEGSLLQRRGVSAPGAEPVAVDPKR